MTCDICNDDQFPGKIIGLYLVCVQCLQTMPKQTLEWLELNHDVRAHKLKCPKCNEWLTGIDPLAPYHWETCWCGKCEIFPFMPKET